jgi:hypothetical protein
MIIQLTIDGVRPMLMHNIRMANPLNEYAIAFSRFSSKRKKTEEDLAQMIQIELRGGVYETDEGLLGLPTVNVRRCVYDAATAFRMGTNVKRALIAETVIEPVLVDGGKVRVEDFLRDDDHVDLQMVRIGVNKVLRARPKVPVPWSTTHRFELLTDVIDPHDLDKVLERAGRLVGLGDYRPTWGTFTTTMECLG